MNGPGNAAQQLRDIHLPEDISWWPPAPGWWLLALLSMVALVLVVHAAVKFYRANAYRRQALQHLQLISQQWPTPNAEATTAVMTLLKRVALSAWPQYHYSALPLSQFIDALNTHCATAPLQLDTADIERLLYADSDTGSVDPTLYQQTQRWLKKHRRTLKGQAPC